MSRLHHFSDEQLTAFLDGEGDFELITAISLAQKTDDQLRNRLERLKIPQVEMSAAFDGLLSSAPAYPAHLTLPMAANQGLFSGLRAVAATAVVCLGVGWLAANYFADRSTEDWHQSVATYHALYVNDTLAQVNQSPAAAQDELKRVAAVLGKAIAPDVLTGSPQLTYKRAQVLGFQGRPLAQLAFLSNTGVPVALCIIKNEKPGDTTISTGEQLGMKTASWSKGEYDYLLVGGTDAALINDAATAFSAKL